MLRFAAPVKVKVPLLVMLNGPAAVVVIAAVNVKFVPTREMPPRTFVSKASRKEVVPDPVSWLNVAARTSGRETLFALWIEMLPKRTVVPTSEEKVMDPVPARRERSCPPSSVLEKVISPAPVPVLSEDVPVRVTGPLKESAAFCVVIEPIKETAPAPVWA